MNAYELSNAIKHCGDSGYNQDASAMLRQQADHIAELEKENTDLRYLIATKLEQQDGISLSSMAHPVGKPVLSEELNPDALEIVGEMTVTIQQQADRIAELEKRCLDLCFSEAYANRSTKVTEELLLERIAELEKREKSAYQQADDNYMSMIKAQERIAELEKKVNHWQEQAGIYKQNLLDAKKLFSSIHSNATEAWESLDLSNQSDLENARAWFFEGFAHGHTSKTKPLSDEEIEKVRVVIMDTAYWCADNGESESYNTVKVMCGEVLAILRGEK